MSLVKNSFTIFETIISFMILAVIVSSFFKILTITNTKDDLLKINHKNLIIDIYKNKNKTTLLINVKTTKTKTFILEEYSLK